jgi:hypothetical protein
MKSNGYSYTVVRRFIEQDNALKFGERLVLLRMMLDVGKKKKYNQDLSTILLKLRYDVAQGIPSDWQKVISVGSEEEIGQLGSEGVDHKVSKLMSRKIKKAVVPTSKKLVVL